MLVAMNFWIGIVLYAVNKPSNLNDNIQTNSFNKQNTSTPNNSNFNELQIEYLHISVNVFFLRMGLNL